jgi:AraC-like DNA-binding protein
MGRAAPAPERTVNGRPSPLSEQIARMAPADGITATALPHLIVYRFSRPASGLHAIYRPSLCVVAQGEKRAHFGRRVIAYDRQRFFFAAVPMAADIDVRRASPEAPLLGLVLQMNLDDIARVALEVDSTAPPAPPLRALPAASGSVPLLAGRADDVSGFVGPLEDELLAALNRLLLCGADPLRGRVLYRHVLQEIVFLLLTGSPGQLLRASLGRGGGARNVIASARYMDENFSHKLSVPLLARRAGMSVSAYYDRFRQVTSLSPMQYLKRVRLQHSRVLLASGISVTEVAFAVGYASTSQFSRDFRSYFALPPSRARVAAS